MSSSMILLAMQQSGRRAEVAVTPSRRNSCLLKPSARPRRLTIHSAKEAAPLEQAPPETADRNSRALAFNDGSAAAP